MGSCQVLPTISLWVFVNRTSCMVVTGEDPTSVTDILLVFQVRHSLSSVLRLGTACQRPCLSFISDTPVCAIFEFLKLQCSCSIDVDDTFQVIEDEPWPVDRMLRDLRHKLGAPDNRHCPPGHIQERVSRKVRVVALFKAILTSDF